MELTPEQIDALHKLPLVWREIAALHERYNYDMLAGADYRDCAGDLDRLLAGDLSVVAEIRRKLPRPPE